jgi:hypothetical protein
LQDDFRLEEGLGCKVNNDIVGLSNNLQDDNSNHSIFIGVWIGGHTSH